MATYTYTQPAHLLQRLLRFNTTNPPGNEMACIHYIQSVLDEVGIVSTIVAKDAQRPNHIHHKHIIFAVSWSRAL